MKIKRALCFMIPAVVLIAVLADRGGYAHRLSPHAGRNEFHLPYFRDSSQAKLKIVINGVFEDTSPNVLSINGKDVAIRKDLPGGLSYTVTETEESAAGYQPAYSVNGADAVQGRAATGALTTNPSVVFTNTRQVVVATGVTANDSFFFIALPVLALCMLLLRKKRGKDTDAR